MRLLKTATHPSVNAKDPHQLTRLTSRAIALKGTEYFINVHCPL